VYSPLSHHREAISVRIGLVSIWHGNSSTKALARCAEGDRGRPEAPQAARGTRADRKTLPRGPPRIGSSSPEVRAPLYIFIDFAGSPVRAIPQVPAPTVVEVTC
jgi:hypothetical protein